MATKKYKAVIVYLDPSVARVLKLMAVDQDTAMTALVREAVEEYLAKKPDVYLHTHPAPSA